MKYKDLKAGEHYLIQTSQGGRWTRGEYSQQRVELESLTRYRRTSPTWRRQCNASPCSCQRREGTCYTADPRGNLLPATRHDNGRERMVALRHIIKPWKEHVAQACAAKQALDKEAKQLRAEIRRGQRELKKVRARVRHILLADEYKRHHEDVELFLDDVNERIDSAKMACADTDTHGIDEARRIRRLRSEAERATTVALPTSLLLAWFKELDAQIDGLT